MQQNDDRLELALKQIEDENVKNVVRDLYDSFPDVAIFWDTGSVTLENDDMSITIDIT